MNQERREREIGISLASLLPWSAVRPVRATLFAKELGFDFVQTLPFRGFGSVNAKLIEQLTQLPIPIRYCEGAWNQWDSFGQVVTNHVKRIAGPPGYPTALDYLLFPPDLKCKPLEQALSQIAGEDGSLPYLISHSFEPEAENRVEAARQLVEVHRGLGLTVE
ncbi:MAG: hypothetical protein CEO22_362, partial [Candidatus Berkelbacteria bacterium Gr01-1014_85]